MANMFSEEKKRSIPTSFHECVEKGKVDENLWVWAERLEKYGKFLFWTLIVFGVVISFASSIAVEPVQSAYGFYEDRSTFEFAVFIGSIIKWGLYAFLEYCAYHILALLVGSLASIVENTRISARIAMLKAVPDNYVPESNKAIEDELIVSENDLLAMGPWRCANCDTQNPSKRKYCIKCGTSKSWLEGKNKE